MVKIILILQHQEVKLLQALYRECGYCGVGVRIGSTCVNQIRCVMYAYCVNF